MTKRHHRISLESLRLLDAVDWHSPKSVDTFRNAEPYVRFVHREEMFNFIRGLLWAGIRN